MLAKGVAGSLQLGYLTSSDPRDMIYALLNLSSDSEALGILPDYSKSFEYVFIQVAKALLLDGYLGVLSYCHFPLSSTDFRHGLQIGLCISALGSID